MQKGQTGRYSKTEVDIIKSAFAGNEDILYEVRDVLMGFRNELSVTFNTEVLDVMKKFILPEISSDVPLVKQSDLFIKLEIIHDLPLDAAILHLEARDVAIDYLRDRFNVLSGGKNERKITDFLIRDVEPEERYKNIIAYQFLATTGNWIESRVYEMEALSLYKEETEEEKKKRLAQNSNK